jgi:hypothetical protein
MTIKTESWILVYFVLGLGCTSRIIEAISQYFNGRSTTERLLTETTSLMSTLNFVKSVNGDKLHPHGWSLLDEPHSVIMVGIWNDPPGILSVLRAGWVFLQVQCQLVDGSEDMQLVLRTPVTVGFAEQYLTYTTFPLLFAAFTKRLNDLIAWNNGTRPGPVWQKQ